MARSTPGLSLLLLLLPMCGLLATPAVADGGVSCLSTQTTVTVSGVPPSTQCVIVYTSSWRIISQSITTANANGGLTLTGLSATVGQIEFYSNSACTAFTSSTSCQASTTAPATTAPTNPATQAPTTAQGPTNQAPTAAATTAPSCGTGIVVSAGSASSCIVQGTSATISVPSSTNCVTLYSSSLSVLAQSSVALANGPITILPSLSGLAFVQTYSDSSCTLLTSDITCNNAPPATSAPTTQAPTTQAPATSAPTTPASTTQAPTTPATQAPTTPAPTTPATTSGVTVSSGNPSCTTSGSSAQIVVPSTSNCVIIYNSNWRVLLSTPVSLTTSASVVSNGLTGIANVEYYSDAQCNNYIDYVACTTSSPGTPPTSATAAPPSKAPTSPPSKAPASSPSKAPTAPTSKATTAPITTNAPVTGPSRAPKNVRAMYVWMYGNCLFNNVPAGTTYASQCGGVSDYLTYQDNILNNLMNPWGQFPRYNRMYLQMDIDNVVNSPDIVRAFLVKAHSMGFAVEYLDGVNTWVESTANAAIPMGYCDQLVAFNQGSTNPAEWIDGIQYDIEPHTLGASWHVVTPGAPDNYNQVYEANLMNIFYHCKAVTRPTSMTVTWSVGNDYYAYVHGLWNPLLTSNPYVDYLTIMNYYSNENSFLYGGSEDGTTDIGGVSNILASLQGGIVPAVFAAETMPPGYAAAWQSFWDLGSAALEKTEADAVSKFGSNPLFAGVATHWYGTYFELPPNGPGKSS